MSGSIGKIIGENVAEAREERGLSQDELADLSKLSRTTIVQLENGHIKDPRKKNIIAIATALDKPVEHFYQDRTPAKSKKFVSPEADDLTNKYLKALEDKIELNDQLVGATKRIDELQDQLKSLQQEVEALKKR